MAAKTVVCEVAGNDGPAPFATQAWVSSSERTLTLAFLQERPTVTLGPPPEQFVQCVDIVARVMMDRETAKRLCLMLAQNLHLDPAEFRRRPPTGPNGHTGG